MAEKLLKKITVRGVFGAVDVNEVREVGTLPLCRIIGRTNKAKPGQTDKGPYVRFVGEFLGINAKTGKHSSSAACILPTVAEDLVVGALQPNKETGEIPTVEFAFDIAVEYDEKSVVKYRYAVTPVMKAKPSDAMADLLGKTQEVPMLEGPKKAKK